MSKSAQRYISAYQIGSHNYYKPGTICYELWGDVQIGWDSWERERDDKQKVQINPRGKKKGKGWISSQDETLSDLVGVKWWHIGAHMQRHIQTNSMHTLYTRLKSI